jgi:hypothetical protein
LKDTWYLIKELFNREYMMICNLDWKSDEGQQINVDLITYNQLIAEEEKRVHDEMDKKTNTGNRK